jgi:hypothetical protein
MKSATERMVILFIILVSFCFFTLAPLLSRDAACRVCAASGSLAQGAGEKKLEAQQPGDSIARALQSSSAKKKFVVALFFEHDDALTRAMKSAFNEAKKDYGKDTALFVAVDVKNKEEQSALAKYEIDKVKKPVLLVLARDGMVIREFVQKATIEDIRNSFVPDKVLTLLKATQEKKLVFVCFPGKDASQYKKAMAEVDNYAKTINNGIVIKVNPEDKSDLSFFSMFKVATEKGETHIAIVNQGNLKGMINGLVDRRKIDALVKGCGSGGCGSG